MEYPTGDKILLLFTFFTICAHVVASAAVQMEGRRRSRTVQVQQV